MLRAVIFDVDGTLVDSVGLHARCWQEAFARYGRQLPLAKVQAQIGKGGDQLIPYFLTPEENERWGEELDHFRAELFREEYLPEVRPFPRVRELFLRIRQDGRRIGLSSSGKEDEIRHYLQLLEVGGLIDSYTTSEDAEKSKPHPDLFAAALAKLGIDAPSEAIAVGDSPFDAEAAGRLGLPTVCVRSGGFSDEDLRKAGCRALYDDPADLLAHYPESPLGQEPLVPVESAPAPGQ